MYIVLTLCLVLSECQIYKQYSLLRYYLLMHDVFFFLIQSEESQKSLGSAPACHKTFNKQYME